MTMVAKLEERDGGTEVTVAFEHLPPGIRPEDNDAGARASFEKLARYIGQDRGAGSGPASPWREPTRCGQ
jgi:hypothetical protein